MQGSSTSTVQRRAFHIQAEDNVATLLDEVAEPGMTVDIVGAGGLRQVTLGAAVKLGHKIALQPIARGEAIVKYGVRIGHASRDIARGEWVHLHNCASDFDERSNTLDGETGAPSDTRYE